jgi:2,3-bisphosphoglycerate-independent phosphoglycerate mutase
LNHRPDGLRGLCEMLTRRGLPPDVAVDLLTDRGKPVLGFEEHCFATLTEIDPEAGLPVVFPPEPLGETCGELVSRAGLSQLRCAETLKRAHVTEFFSGGRSAPFSGETRLLVPSPLDVERYHERPALRSRELGAAVARAVRAAEADFVLVNFAAPDVVAHSAELEATMAAVRAVDQAVGEMAAAVLERQGALLVTSDHGNAELVQDGAGTRHPAHTLNPVPFVLVHDPARGASLGAGGSLCDVAPTVLDLLGIEPPAIMTGRSLRPGASPRKEP